jgi:hypothetical protein
MVAAPLRVPVELRHGERWFRLAVAISPSGLQLGSALPEELNGPPLEVAFHLPGDGQAIRCVGRAAAERVGEGEDERIELRSIALVDIKEVDRARIATYVEERSGTLS